MGFLVREATRAKAIHDSTMEMNSSVVVISSAVREPAAAGSGASRVRHRGRRRLRDRGKRIAVGGGPPDGAHGAGQRNDAGQDAPSSGRKTIA